MDIKDLSPEQAQKVIAWVHEGLSLSDIQKHIENDFGTKVTYRDVRFLVDDLNLEIIDAPTPAQQPPAPAAEGAQAPAQPAEAMPMPGQGESNMGGGAVKVTMDTVQRPGAVASGNVTFSDGETASWQVDAYGRLALNPATEGYQPNQADIQAFQLELQSQIGA